MQTFPTYQPTYQPTDQPASPTNLPCACTTQPTAASAPQALLHPTGPPPIRVTMYDWFAKRRLLRHLLSNPNLASRPCFFFLSVLFSPQGKFKFSLLLLGIVGYTCRINGGKIKRRRLENKYVAFYIRYIRFQR